MDARKITAEIRRKMDAVEPLTRRDISHLSDAARMSGRMQDKLLYVEAKTYLIGNNDDREPTEEERLQELRDAVDIAHEKAIRSGTVSDRLTYVDAKHALAEASEEGEQQLNSETKRVLRP